MAVYLTEFWNKLGPAGVALLLLSVYGLYLGLKNTFFLFNAGRSFNRDMRNFENGELEIEDIYGRSRNPLTDIVCRIAADHGSHSQDIRAEVAYLFHRNFAKVNRDVTCLRLVAVVSPLLGLLGTVLGIVDVFRVLAQTAAPESRLLAAGLWEALLTTIIGLSVAVPALFFYYGLHLKLRGFQIEAVEYSYRVSNASAAGSVGQSPETVSPGNTGEKREKGLELKRLAGAESAVQ